MSGDANGGSDHFGDALIARVRELGHPLCVGLDPHLDRIPPPFRAGTMAPAAPATADAVEAFCRAVVDRVAGRVAAVKPQVAFFEQLGWPGMRALERVVAHARGAGLLVVLDAKRGDIGSTAAGYAQAYLAADAPLAVDAMTLNPYLGLESLAPFAQAAQQCGRGFFVLAKTSNPGSGELQDLEVGGVPIYERVAASLAPLAGRLAGPATGWSSLGIVAGATWPAQHEALRARLPRALFLVPGYGAQGASADDALRGFVSGPKGLEGGLVSSSRALLFPPDGEGGDRARWEASLDEALARSTAELAQAVARSGAR